MGADLVRLGFQRCCALHDDSTDKTSMLTARCIIRRRAGRSFDCARAPNKHSGGLEELASEGVARIGSGGVGEVHVL